MGRIPEDIINKIIEYNDIVDVISEYVQLKKVGRNYVGVCPFHNDKGPSLSVSPDKQLFHCFGCGAAGNTIGFIMKIRNYDYKDALLYLAERAGIDVSFDGSKDKNKDLKEKLYKINLEAARYFYNNLKSSKIALNYLYSRGIDNKIINRFGLGYSLNEWDALIKHLKNMGYSEEEMSLAGLLVKSEKGIYDRFRNRIMFPIFDVKGRVIAFGGRVLDDSKPKYLNTSETLVFEKGKNLYGLNYVIKNKNLENIIVVEGYMDCIKLHQFGLNNVVASLGTALTTDHSKLLKRYTNNIYICYDSDAAGQAATLRGIEILESAGLNVKVIIVPSGKDPDEFVKNNGIDEFKKLIKDALFITDYRILKAKEGKNIKNQFDKVKYVNEVVDVISKLKDEVLVQHYSEKLSEETGISLNVIIDKVNKNRTNITSKNNNSNIRNNIKGNIYNLIPANKKAEAYILSILLNYPSFYEKVFTTIKPEEFLTEVYRELALEVLTKIPKGEEIDKNYFLNKYQEQEKIEDIARVFSYSIGTEDDIAKLLNDSIKTVKRFSLEQKINNLKSQIKKCELENDIHKSVQLMQHLIELQKELDQI
ncbi:DNA primase [Caloramator proteoclasticus]|uniref:DNA primase n=1 Tax=Caloramator proteoclasticus DSM 10124 TaxID=1121262 RepID=A0A1M4WVZ8_9CLOT|nr:DNA primase [Caloramator proteoclasticus]SHE85414.1 DNA primase [Caloramator proteoclasticus DSM 10124]